MEGPKQVLDLSRDHQIELLLHTREDSTVESLAARSLQTARLEPGLFSRLSSVRTHQGVMAFFPKPSWHWKDVSDFVLYLEELQDPGNVGTLVRTARATGLFSLTTSPGTVSLCNAKVVRASSAALMKVPFLENIALEELKQHEFRLIAASPGASRDMLPQQFHAGTAFLIGNEGRGLTRQALRLADQAGRIPMQEDADSLNAAVVGSLIMYQVYLQERAP